MSPKNPKTLPLKYPTATRPVRKITPTIAQIGIPELEEPDEPTFETSCPCFLPVSPACLLDSVPVPVGPDDAPVCPVPVCPGDDPGPVCPPCPGAPPGILTPVPVALLITSENI